MDTEGRRDVKRAHIVLVCGGRDYTDRDFLRVALDTLSERKGNVTILHGGCHTGADSLAEEWAASRERPSIIVRAEWSKYGKSAGPRRNAIMLHYIPDGVVAFPGGSGTLDMCRKAEDAGFAVWHPCR